MTQKYALIDSQHFLSTGYSPELVLESPNGSHFPLADLPPFLRSLLTTDGTVTKTLESFFWEPVKVTHVQQSLEYRSNSLDRANNVEDFDVYLNVNPGEAFLSRHVELMGQNTHRHYLSANSTFAIEHLPGKIRQDLEAMNIGIGEILRECGLETYRKIVAFGVTDAKDKIWRDYLIYIDGKPVVKIRELFELGSFV